MGTLIDLTGKRFGRLLVIGRAETDSRGKLSWLCKCDCGNEKTIRGDSLQGDRAKSCGCLQKEIASIGNRTHGLSKVPTYEVWYNMQHRCFNKNNHVYKNYGGRGITVCDRWLKFENFYEDMGDKPKGLTLDRNDNHGNYEPSNCSWVTRKEQSRNIRSNRMIKYGGREQCMAEWAEEIGISQNALGCRLKKYPPQIAFNM